MTSTEEQTRVLLVEDDLDIQTISKLSLEASGQFVVKACDGGEQALASAAEFAPDLILLDVMMPGMDGPTTLEALRQKPDTADVPVIFMTAKVQTENRKQYHELGAVGVIAKPYDPMALASTIHDILAKAAT